MNDGDEMLTPGKANQAESPFATVLKAVRAERDRLGAELVKARQEIAAHKDRNQRLADLVRYKRHELHLDGLITDDEYAQIVQDHGAVARLEGYDRLQRDLALAKLNADVWESTARSLSDAKIPGCGHHAGYAFSADGGKAGFCALCRVAELEKALRPQPAAPAAP